MLDVFDNGMYVIKEIRLANLKPKRRKNVAQEVLLLRKLHHPNIIQYYTSFVENHALHIVMEYADGGDMYRELRKRRHDKKPMDEKNVWHYFSQCCLALRYLHQENIIHRDIKSMNVFLTKSKVVKLGDLGVSRLVDEDRNAQMSRVGTPMYFAPELVKREQYDFKVDAWALGCLVYSMMQLRAPFEGGNIYTLAVDIVKKSPKELPKRYSRQLRDVVFTMLEKDPKRRPSIDEIIQMFPYNLRNKLNDSIGNNNNDTSSSSQNYSTNTNSTLSRTRSSSRNSFYNQSGGSQKGGGGRIEFKQNMDNILAWKTIEDNTLETVKEGKKMSSTIETNSNTIESSTIASTFIRQDDSSSVPSTKMIRSVDETDSSIDSVVSEDDEDAIVYNRNDSRRKNTYEGKMNDNSYKRSISSNRQRRSSPSKLYNKSDGRRSHSSDRSNSRQRQNNHIDEENDTKVIVNVHNGEMKRAQSRHIINPEKFFDGTQKYLRKQNRPFSAGRVRDRRNLRSSVEQNHGKSRRQRPQSAGPSRRKNYANNGRNKGGISSTNRRNDSNNNEYQFQRQHQRRRPQSAGVGNRRRRWNAPAVDLPASTRMIVVKQYGVS